MKQTNLCAFYHVMFYVSFFYARLNVLIWFRFNILCQVKNGVLREIKMLLSAEYGLEVSHVFSEFLYMHGKLRVFFCSLLGLYTNCKLLK